MYKGRINEENIKKFHRSLDLYEKSKLRRFLENPFKNLYCRIVNACLKIVKKTKSKIVKTFWGDEMMIFFPGHYSTFIYKYGFVEEYLITYMLNYLREKGTFIDIGAHYGFFSLLASEIVGPSGEVHSFEPTPSTYKILQNNTMDKTNIYTNNCLLWSSSKELSFRDYGAANSEINSLFPPRRNSDNVNNAQYIELKIMATTVDEYVDSKNIHPDFIKIDAESAETEILKGMEKTISKYKPAIAVELGDYNVEKTISSRKIIDFLVSRGYVPFEYFNRGIREHKIMDNYNYQVLLFV